MEAVAGDGETISFWERGERKGRLLTATMSSARMSTTPILVRNISGRGLGAKARGTLPLIGEEVVIQFDGQELVGRIRWVRGNKFGAHLRDSFCDVHGAATTMWPQITPPEPGFHVFDRFKPVGRAWRPGVKRQP